MTADHLIKNAVTRPDFQQERLTPILPGLVHYELITLNGNLALKVYLTNLPKAEEPVQAYPRYPGLPAKIKIAGSQVRFDYHDATELKTA